MSIFVKTFDPQEVKRADFDFDGAVATLADALRKEGVDVYSLAIIDSMKPGEIVFRN